MLTIGVDEAGRGCWAGPLVAAAVYFPKPTPTATWGLADSKKLSAAARDRLFALIVDRALVGIGMASPNLIDNQGLSAAQTQAMSQAVANLPAPTQDCQIIVDGSVNYLPQAKNSRCQVGADGTVAAVMAAGIVAKVTRDRFCCLLDRLYPDWGLAGHKGYGTAQHQNQLQQRQPIRGLHRLSYRPVGLALTRP